MKVVEQQEIRKSGEMWYIMTVQVKIKGANVAQRLVLSVDNGPFETREDAEIVLYEGELQC